MRLPVLIVLALLAFAVGNRVLTGAAPRPGTVTRVVDGDTLHVSEGGRDTTVRLLGIDTPELHKPNVPVECGARAAAAAMRRLVDGKRVRVRADPTQDNRDVYGRRLGYVSVAGRDVALALLSQGWAAVYVYDRPVRRIRAYRAAAQEARVTGRGVWARCGGDFHSAQD